MNCPQCGSDAVHQDWLPKSGLDPLLRKYKCTQCDVEFYVRTGNKIRTKIPKSEPTQFTSFLDTHQLNNNDRARRPPLKRAPSLSATWRPTGQLNN